MNSNERFVASSSARHAALSLRREARKEESGQDESTEFWSQFSPEAEALSAEVEKAETIETMQLLEKRGKELSERVTMAGSWLAPFDLKRAQREARRVESEIVLAKKRIAPRKKFGFKSKLSTSTTTTPKQQPSLDPINLSLETKVGFFGERGRVLTWTETGREIHLDDLRDCVVFVPQPITALRMRGLVDCDIYCAAVEGPAYVEGVRRSRIRLAARQLRIHHSHQTDFFVALASGPIIEDCTRLRFADSPLRWRHATIDPAKLPLKPDAFKLVRDFKWVKASEPSPNFSFVDTEEEKHAHVTPHLSSLTAIARQEADRIGLSSLS